MHYSAKQQRINGKVKNHISQIPALYNGGMHYLSTPNVSNTGQLQVNRKFVNNMGNINHVSFLQYQRTTNMQIKSDLEMNHYQSIRHHQQQHAFVYKAPQYHKIINPNIQHKMSVNHLTQRKILKEPTIPAGVLQQPLLNVDLASKKCKELQNQESNKLYSKHKTTQGKYRKSNSKDSNNEKGSNEVTDENLIKPNQVPETLNEVDESMQCNKGNTNVAVPQNDITQILNNEQSDGDKCENATDKSSKTAREKTPMCLINDLARFNKISFQYRLTSENGPAHCKRFTVTLILGDEEYTAEGLKIKQAQHLAAKEAIEKTKYKHPTPKTNRSDDSNTTKSNITPTVELNALAMKLGQQTYYIFDPQQIENNSNYLLMNNAFERNNTLPQQNSNVIVENLITNSKQVVSIHPPRQYLSKFQNRYNQFQNNSTPAAYAYFPPTSPCKITLIVGTKEFVGIGRTIQQAKHDAASHALKVLKEQLVTEQLESQNQDIEDSESKSPISLVFEIGIKRCLPVDFKVLREEGPAHMRTFITACIVGDIVTEGEGTGKKISKKKAAQKMLEELKKLPTTPVASPTKRTKVKPSSKKTYTDQSKSDNLVESKAETTKIWHKNKTVTSESEAANPINKLLEWHQNHKENEPEFKLISEIGKENTRKKQFVMEVSSNKIVARGVGTSKRLAKQNAAQNFLAAIAESNGYTTTNELGNTAKTANNKKINKNYTELNISGHNKNTSEQLANAHSHSADIENNPTYATTIAAAEQNENAQKPLNFIEVNKNVTEKNSQKQCEEQESIDKTVIGSSSAASTDAVSKENTNSGKNSTKSQNHHMKDQLMYLAKLLGFDVEFSDYPKCNHDEFLTIVMLSTTPPQICHGVGANANDSQEDAARNALKILSEMGLNNAVKS